MDADTHKVDWQTVKINDISKGQHTLVWRYRKLNILNLTEFMESEIEVSVNFVIDWFLCSRSRSVAGSLSI